MSAGVRIFPHGLRSFRSQVALGFGGLAVAVAVTLSLTLGSMFADKSERDEAADLRTIANNAAKVLSDGLSIRSRQVESLANSPTLWSDGLKSDRVAQTIARSHSLTPHSAWIGVVSPDGVVQTATDRLLLGVNVGERPWFQEGRQKTHVGDVHAAKLLASLLPRGTDGGPQRFVDFSSPILRDGQLIGVIGMHGSWEWARSVVESLLPDDAQARGLEVFVLARDGQVIYASRRAERSSETATPSPAASTAMAASAASGSTSFTRDANGAEFLAGIAKVKAHAVPVDLGWSVVAREPAAVALAAAHEGIKRSLLFGLLASLAACALGWVMAERLTRPLREIVAAAKRVEDGERDAGIPQLGGSSEVTQLSTALAGMTAKLVSANVELESRVKERTAALEQANAELDRQARIDPLTNVLNRRGMEERFQHALASARRRKTPLSVLMVDIDHFKRVNDTFGHDAGDVALRALAATLTRRLRETDVVARLGGEEFVAILPDTDAAQARSVADALVVRVGEELVEPVGRITISCGVAQVQMDADDAQSVLRRADEALYRAKGEGRNRASFADTSIELGAATL